MKLFNKDKALRNIKIEKNKNTYIKRLSVSLSCLFLILVVMLFTFAKYISNSPEYSLIQGRVAELSKDINIIAIYQGDEQVNEIPAKGSGWIFDRAECDNGTTATWDDQNWNITLNLTAKTKCTLYFMEQVTTEEYITDLVYGADTTSIFEIGNTGLAYDGTTDNNLRYIGSNPNNYISFNNELWRIIGLMNNVQTEDGNTESLLKIIRKDSLGNYAWDSSSTGANNGFGINQWGESGTYEGADLMRELNTDYLGNITIATDGRWYSGKSDAKAATRPTTTLSTEAQNMIESVIWHLGSPNNNNGTALSYDNEQLKAPYMYTHERANTSGKLCSNNSLCTDTVTRKTTWTGKIGLFYPSDYLYATSGGSTVDRQMCLNNKGYYWLYSSIEECKNNDWLYKYNQTEWTMSPFTDTTSNASSYIIYKDGSTSKDTVNYTHVVRPVAFLKSSVSIIEGAGTQTNPYILR